MGIVFILGGIIAGVVIGYLFIRPLIFKFLRWVEYRNGDLWIAENDLFWANSFFIWENRNKN